MIDDERLILYYYGDDLSEAERSRIAAALGDDDELAGRYRALSADLDALRVLKDQPAPAEAIVRWRYELDKAVAAERPALSAHPTAWLVAAAAVLVVGIAIGLNLAGKPTTDKTIGSAPPPTAATGQSPPAAVTRGVTAYLQRSQIQLVGLKDADAEERIELITDIIEQNRLFERAADANGAPALARVLRAFEQTLVALAREEAAPRDVAAGADQLSFEFAVMLTGLSRPASKEPYSL